MIDRRAALAGLAAAPMIAGAAAMSLDTPAARLRAFMLMRGALDDRLVIGFLTGSYVGVVDSVATPLFDLVSATFSRYRRRADGGYDGVTLEQAYFLDRASGEWLHRFTNPYTGKTVDVPTGGYPPARIVFTAGLDMLVPAAPAGQRLDHRVSGFRVQGGNVWATEITEGSTPAPGGKTLAYHETVGLHARAAEFMAPGARQVRTETSYTSIKGWRPWLGMADHPGGTVSSGQGMYGATMADLPATWLAAARTHRPDLVVDPARVLDPIWRSGG